MIFTRTSIFFLLMTFGGFIPCFSQQSQTDLEKMNLKGPVKSIEYESYTVNMKKKKKQKEWIQTFFNEAGNKTLEFTRETESPELAASHEYTYDGYGRLKSIAHFDMDSNLQTRHCFIYDSTKLKEEEHIFDKDSTLKLKYIYQFNDKGLKVSIDGYDMKQQTNNRIANYSFQYDSFGNKTEETTTLVSGYTTYRYRYDYGDSSQIMIKYITLIQGENFESSRSIQYIYDKNGNIVEEQWAYGDEPFRDKSTYTLDKNSNWIKRVDNVNGKESYFAERKITYY
jgi:hypothetical protein